MMNVLLIKSTAADIYNMTNSALKKTYNHDRGESNEEKIWFSPEYDIWAVENVIETDYRALLNGLTY